ncbi:hypothetical protein SKAU_G00225610 [Synaphobranchus kaupii]|uniref:C-type lectin domain-containing protein n=1 Tax=Synaphobranchus kaupii TaxID=118154 RepID=A0A9Q1IVY7_SYNKA|nr:hypothetical protein SKAU_G00225610 [Synaphobranchus kaupii]
MELQEMKIDEATSQEKEEIKPKEDKILEGGKVESDSEYTKLGIPAEDIYSEPSFPHPSTAPIRVQSQTVCHGENEIPGERVPTPNLCTPRECRQVCLAETSRALLCSKCDDGWQHFEGSCFYLSTKLHNWSKSREECRKMAGDLVVIGDQRLKEFLVEKGKMAYWIGAIQIKNGETVWVNATVGESYWDQNQIRGNCGYLLGGDSPSQSWHASPCSHETSYICQKNA